MRVFAMNRGGCKDSHAMEVIKRPVRTSAPIAAKADSVVSPLVSVPPPIVPAAAVAVTPLIASSHVDSKSVTPPAAATATAAVAAVAMPAVAPKVALSGGGGGGSSGAVACPNCCAVSFDSKSAPLFILTGCGAHHPHRLCLRCCEQQIAVRVLAATNSAPIKQSGTSAGAASASAPAAASADVKSDAKSDSAAAATATGAASALYVQCVLCNAKTAITSPPPPLPNSSAHAAAPAVAAVAAAAASDVKSAAPQTIGSLVIHTVEPNTPSPVPSDYLRRWLMSEPALPIDHSAAAAAPAPAAATPPVASPPAVVCSNECGRPSELDCLDCRVPYCRACADTVHAAAAALRHHKRVPRTGGEPAISPAAAPAAAVQSGPTLCRHHPTEAVSLYCQNCSALACVLCSAVNPHRQHRTVALVAAQLFVAADLKRAEVGVIERSRALALALHDAEHMSSTVVHTHSSLDAQVRSVFAELRSVLDYREQQLLHSSASIRSDKLTRLASQYSALHVLTQQTATALHSLTAVSTVDALASADTDARRVHTHRAVSELPAVASLQLSPAADSKLHVVFHLSALQSAIAGFGNIGLQSAPSAPASLQCTDVTGTSVTLSWSPPTELATAAAVVASAIAAQTPVVTYKLQCRAVHTSEYESEGGKQPPATSSGGGGGGDHGGGDAGFHEIASGAATTFVVRGLARGTLYKFRVCAANSAGESGYATLSVITRGGRVFNPLYDFDTNGLLYYLGSSGDTKSWVNPATANIISVHRSEPHSNAVADPPGPVSNAVERGAVSDDLTCFTAGTCAGLWFVFDLREYPIIPSAYTLRHDSGAGDFIRNWNFDGSIDGQRWTTLRSHTDDQSIQSAGGSATWNIEAATTTDTAAASASASASGAAAVAAPPVSAPIAYRYFRVITTGLSSSDSHTLVIGGFEIYGTSLAIDEPKTIKRVKSSSAY